jgi:hypothetical protein
VCITTQNPEHSMIEPGAIRIGKYLAAGLGFLLLGVVILVENGRGRKMIPSYLPPLSPSTFAYCWTSAFAMFSSVSV